VATTLPQNDGRNKKADVAEHPWGFDQVGLLLDEPPDQPGCPSLSLPMSSIGVFRGWMQVRITSATVLYCAYKDLNSK
jgi:hypothetical protein